MLKVLFLKLVLVWRCIWGFKDIFGMSGLVFWVLNLYFWCLDLYFGFWTCIWVSGLLIWVSELILRVSGSGRAGSAGRPGRVSSTFGGKIHFGNLYPKKNKY